MNKYIYLVKRTVKYNANTDISYLAYPTRKAADSALQKRISENVQFRGAIEAHVTIANCPTIKLNYDNPNTASAAFAKLKPDSFWFRTGGPDNDYIMYDIEQVEMGGAR